MEGVHSSVWDTEPTEHPLFDPEPVKGPKTVHIGFRAEDGRVSPVFTFVVDRRSNVYISDRDHQGNVKVSLHASGLCSYSVSSEAHAKSGRPNRDRHFLQWQLPVSTETRLAFRIVIPEHSLHPSRIHTAMEAMWARAPRPGEVVSIGVWIAAAHERCNLIVEGNRPVLTAVSSDYRYVAIKLDYGPPTPEIANKIRGFDHNGLFAVLAFEQLRSGSMGLILLS